LAYLIDAACLSIMADIGDEISGKIIVVGFSLEWPVKQVTFQLP
jgi:hypothetical protein